MGKMTKQARTVATTTLMFVNLCWGGLNTFVSAAMLPANLKQVGSWAIDSPWYLPWGAVCITAIMLIWTLRSEANFSPKEMQMNGDDRSIRNIFGNSGVINTGDIFHRPPDRKLNPRLEADILGLLKPGMPVDLEVSTDQEAMRFATEIEAFIRRKGYNDINRINVMVSFPPHVGQAVFQRDGKNVISIGVREN